MRDIKDLPESELDELLTNACRKTNPRMTTLGCSREARGLKKCPQELCPRENMPSEDTLKEENQSK